MESVFSVLDAKYDGPLTKPGAPQGVFFTACPPGERLPLVSPCPRGDKYSAEQFPRFSIKISSFELDQKYSWFFVKETTTRERYTQFLIACVSNENPDAFEWAEDNLKERLDPHDSQTLLYRSNGQWNCAKKTTKCVVNLFVFHQNQFPLKVKVLSGTQPNVYLQIKDLNQTC